MTASADGFSWGLLNTPAGPMWLARRVLSFRGPRQVLVRLQVLHDIAVAGAARSSPGYGTEPPEHLSPGLGDVAVEYADLAPWMAQVLYYHMLLGVLGQVAVETDEERRAFGAALAEVITAGGRMAGLESVFLTSMASAWHARQRQVFDAGIEARSSAGRALGVGAGLPYAYVFDTRRSALVLIGPSGLARLSRGRLDWEEDWPAAINDPQVASISALGRPAAVGIARAGAAYAGAAYAGALPRPSAMAGARLVLCNDSRGSFAVQDADLGLGRDQAHLTLGAWERLAFAVGDDPEGSAPGSDGDDGGPVRTMTDTCPEGPGATSLVFDTTNSWLINGLPLVDGGRGFLSLLAAVDKPRAHSSVRRGAGRPYLVFLAPPGAGEGGDKAARIARAIGDAGGLTAVSLEPEWVEQSERGVVAHWPPDAFGNGWRANRPDLIACLGVGSIATVPRSPFDGLAGAGTGPQGERRVRETFNSWSVRVLERARADGICVNYEPSFFQMGNKSVLERRCRHFESQGGGTVLRPRTWVVAPGGEGSLRRDLGNAGPGPLIVKPAEGAQGYGLRFASHPDDLPDVTTESVVQEVVRDPLTLDGHKIDIRAYLVVRCGPEEAYRVASFMMIRRAVARYEVGTPTAEITNIAYARRRGQVVNAVPLDALAASVDTGSVRRAVKATLRQLCAMLAMYAPPAGFAAVWGVDLALSRHEGQLQALLLEVNTAPEIYRGDGALDAETDLMLTTEVGPWLREHLAARRVDVASARRVSPAGPRPAPRP